MLMRWLDDSSSMLAYVQTMLESTAFRSQVATTKIVCTIEGVLSIPEALLAQNGTWQRSWLHSPTVGADARRATIGGRAARSDGRRGGSSCGDGCRRGVGDFAEAADGQQP